MQVDIVNQMFGLNDFSHRLKSHLSGASAGWRFRVLVAFLKRNGLGLLEPELTTFLKRKGETDWIVGVDCGGTSPDALEYLYGLSKTYPKQVNAKVFSAGSPFHVFHPKLYLLDSQNRLLAWLGSANLTAGGMFLNCECMTEFNITRNVDVKEANLLEAVWSSYASSFRYLSNLTPQVISKVADRYGPEQSAEAWEPPVHPLEGKDLSGLPRLPRPPRLTTSLTQSSQPALKVEGSELIMEILQETRDTQVQIPVEVLERYFGIRQGEKAMIALRYIEGGQIKAKKYRNIIYPTSHVRIEMETISGLQRPIIAIFHRDLKREDTYEYELLKNGTRYYRSVRALLLLKGKRTSGTSRWYLIQ